MDEQALRVFDGLEGLGAIPAGAIVSVGNFDGVHLGHATILSTARRLKQQSAASAVALVPFEPHPNTVLRPEAAPPRLTPPALKQSLLAAAGADVLLNLPPAPEV